MLILVSTVTGCFSVSVFAPLVCVPVGITSSTVGLNICVIIAGIKKYKSIVKKREEEEAWKNIGVRKDKLNSIEVLIYKAFR